MSADGTPGLASPIGSTLSGRYRLVSKLGSGGMSTVYLAKDETLERSVAVKVLHAGISDQPDQIERFRREARAVAQLSHPNVVAVIDAGEDGGHPYIVFEYVEGETLKQRIDRLGRLPVDEAAAYAIEIGRGLAAAHARMLVHRDVKPQNVLIDAEGRAKVTDFGIALSLESDGLTKTGRVLGTTDYVSPEQAMGQDVDARSDIYSLGILLYEMLTGHPPFQAETLVGRGDEARQRADARHPGGASPGLRGALGRDRAGDREGPQGPLRRHGGDARRPRGRAGRRGDPRRGRHRRGDDRDRVGAGASAASCPAARSRSPGSCSSSPPPAVALGIAALTGDDERRASRPSRGRRPPAPSIELTRPRTSTPRATAQEHAEEVGQAIDGNPDTAVDHRDVRRRARASTCLASRAWVSSSRPPSRWPRAEMTITSATEGWSGEVYAGDATGPPDDLAGWGSPVGTISRRRAREETVALDDPRGGELLPAVDHRPRRIRGRLRRRDRRDRADCVEQARWPGWRRLKVVAPLGAVALDRELHEAVADLRVGLTRTPRRALRTRWWR